MTRVARRALVWAVVLTLALLAGCGEDEGGGSQTPRVRAGPVTELADAVLTTKDLRSVSGLPDDIEAVSLDEAAIFEDPDPRTPCGAKIDQPEFDRGQGVALRSGQAAGFTVVLRLPVARATAYLGALEAGTRVGCPAYDRKSNTGSIQQVKLVKEVGIGSLGDQQVAALLTIDNEGPTGHAILVAIRRAERVAMLVLFSRSQASDDVVRAIAVRASDRLEQGR